MDNLPLRVSVLRRARQRPALSRWRALLLLGALAACMCGCGAGGPPPPSAPSPLLGKPLPDFKRRTVDGATVDTAAQRGKVVIIKFFAKYCIPCKKSLPAAERLHQKDPELVIIGVAEDEYRADVDAMISTYQLTFPIVHDRGNMLAGRYRVSEMPVAFVADANGNIRWVAGETHTEEDLERAVAAAR